MKRPRREGGLGHRGRPNQPKSHSSVLQQEKADVRQPNILENRFFPANKGK